MKRLTRWKRKHRQTRSIGFLVLGIVFALVCWQNLQSAREAPSAGRMWGHVQTILYRHSIKTHMPAISYSQPQGHKALGDYVTEKVMNLLPVYQYAESLDEHVMQVESHVTYEIILAREGADEMQRSLPPDKAGDEAIADADDTEQADAEQADAGLAVASEAVRSIAPVEIPLERLGDFDYLLKNFYVVDPTTNTNSGQLNAALMMEQDLRLKTGNEQPQILIYHTHSQETYVDSDGSPASTVVGVGERLAQVLRESYGLNVLHDTGVYDLPKRDSAYSVAGPVVQKILADHPSIEVIIDLHRDGVREGLHLVSEVNGKQTAKIMFFNGLSRTTKNGDIAYLANPNLPTNLAFSFQMKLAAEQYYPGFTRGIYLTGYRYNLHFLPKSLLVEVGAQTNTLEEAMNTVEPLADLLHKVLVLGPG